MSKNSKISYKSLTQSYIRMYELTGVLPLRKDREEKTIFRLMARLYPRLCLVSAIIFNAIFISYCVRMIEERNLDLDFVTEFVVAQGVYLRYYVFYVKRKELVRLFDRCRALWSSHVRDDDEDIMIMKKSIRIVHYFKLFFYCTNMTAPTFYLLTAIFVRLPPEELGGAERRVLLLRTYSDIQDEPWYTSMIVVQVIVSYTISIIAIAFETICPIMIMMACGYLKIVQNRLLLSSSTGQLIDCIFFHQKILKFCTMIITFSNTLLMIQISTTVYNTALLGIMLLEKNSNYMKQLSLLFVSMLQFLICHWMPENLVNESTTVSSAAYQASLVQTGRFDRATGKVLLMAMVRAQRPVQVTAGGYITLSFESFKQMTTSAFSFFTVVRNLKM